MQPRGEVLAAQDSKAHEFNADLHNESARKNCGKIARQMAIEMSCMKT